MWWVADSWWVLLSSLGEKAKRLLRLHHGERLGFGPGRASGRGRSAGRRALPRRWCFAWSTFPAAARPGRWSDRTDCRRGRSTRPPRRCGWCSWRPPGTRGRRGRPTATRRSGWPPGCPRAGATSGSRTAWTMRRTWNGESSQTCPSLARVARGPGSRAPNHCHTPSFERAPSARALLIRTSATSAGGRVTSTVPGAVEVGAT